MKFKAGDRVHVTRLNESIVDFYGTISYIDEGIAKLIKCSDGFNRNRLVYLHGRKEFGKNKIDYCTLVTDEEDTEAPVVQRVEDIKRYIPNAKEFIESAFKAAEKSKYDFNQLKEQNQKVELDNHYIIEVKKGLYVEEIGSNNHFKFTKDITEAHIYQYKQSIIRHAELVDGLILNIKRYIEV